jgi:FkbM family methyltransferase
MSNIAERIVHRLDVAVRRQSRLGQHAWLRKILLRPYRKLINFHGRGVLMNIGGCLPARLPAEYAWREIEHYEPATVAVLKQWLEKADRPLVVDAGCSYGFITCAGLFGNSSSRVIAIDSDLRSLKVAQCLSSCAPQVAERLKLAWGFISSEATDDADFDTVNKSTLRTLAESGVTGDHTATRYVCLDVAEDAAKPIPRHTLDGLIPPGAFANASILIKCDVEGAEMHVLKGAKRLLAERRPSLLISVHPSALPRNGASKEELTLFLTERGYSIDVFAVDYEEHWWATPT